MDRRSFFRNLRGGAAAAAATATLIEAAPIVQSFENPDYGKNVPQHPKPPEKVSELYSAEQLACNVAQEGSVMLDEVLDHCGYFDVVRLLTLDMPASKDDVVAWPEVPWPRPLKTGTKNDVLTARLDHHVFSLLRMGDVTKMFEGSGARAVRIQPMVRSLFGRIVEGTDLSRVYRGTDGSVLGLRASKVHFVATAPTGLPFSGSGACGYCATNKRFPVRCLISYDPNSLGQLITLDVLFGVRGV